MMMAAMRSATAMLSRRSCGSLGSSAAASMAKRGLETRQIIGAAAPRMQLLHPVAARNLEGLRRFSTETMEGAAQDKSLLMKHKAESILRMWWQRSRDSVKNFMKDQSFLVATTINFVTFYCSMKLDIGSGTNTRTITGDIRTNVHPHQSPQPIAYIMIPGLRAYYRSSLHTVCP